MNERYLKVEFDPAFFGGRYEGTGNQVLIAEDMVLQHGMSKAFQESTGHNPANIVRFAEDVFYNLHGVLIEEPQPVLPEEGVVELPVDLDVQIPEDPQPEIVDEPVPFLMTDELANRGKAA